MISLGPDISPFSTRLTSSGATVLSATGRLNFPAVDAMRRQLHQLVKIDAAFDDRHAHPERLRAATRGCVEQRHATAATLPPRA